VLEKPAPIAVVMIAGGIVLLFIEKLFRNPRIDDESRITIPRALAVGFWQCLAMMPGVSRAAASIIGGMQQKMTRSAAAEFSFFLAVPTMLAVTVYSIFLKKWHVDGMEQKGIAMITSDNMHLVAFIAGNFVAFIVAAMAIRFFITFLKRYGFRMWGWYRIVAGLVMLAFIYIKAG
jgi:undecaprenyl-diphosphatase